MSGPKSIFFLSLFAFIVSVLCTLIWPEATRQALGWKPSQRGKILSTTTGLMRAEGGATKVIKFRTPSGIRLEFFSPQEQGQRKLISELELKGHFNAFFDLDGFSTDLALVDLNNDGQNELIAPTLDENLLPRLNAFQYDPVEARIRPFAPTEP